MDGYYGIALLHYIIRSRCGVDSLRYLVSKGVSLDIQDYNGCTPLHVALEYRSDPEVVAFLFKNTTNFNTTNNDTGSTLLHAAVNRRCGVDMLRDLVSRGASLDIQDNHGCTPLHLALEYRSDPEVVAFLFENTTNFNTTNNDTGSTLLHAAVNRRCGVDMLRDLVSKGVSLDIQDNHGCTPLHLALDKYRSNSEVFAFLFENTTNFNTTNNDTGDTLLHAVIQLHITLHEAIYGLTGLSLIRSLIDNGCDFAAKNRHGITAFHLITEQRKLRLLTESFPAELDGLRSVQLSQLTTLYDVLVLRRPFDWHSVERPLECVTERNRPFWSVILSSIVAQGAYSFCLWSGDVICLDEYSTRSVMRFLEERDVVNVLLAHWPLRGRRDCSQPAKKRKLK